MQAALCLYEDLFVLVPFYVSAGAGVLLSFYVSAGDVFSCSFLGN